MHGQERRRRGTPGHKRQQASARWVLWTAGGLALAVVVVVGLLVGADVSKSEEGLPSTTYVMDSTQVSTLASTGHTLGSAGAPVTILEFVDFQCPYCERFWSGPLKEIEEELVETGQAVIVYKHFIVVGPESMWAGVAREAQSRRGVPHARSLRPSRML